jgi:hypothetical protein
MRRREFIVGLGSAAAWPAVARAQQPTPPVIGFVSPAAAGVSGDFVAAFRKGLGEAATSMARTLRSSTTGWRVNTNACRR